MATEDDILTGVDRSQIHEAYQREDGAVEIVDVVPQDRPPGRPVTAERLDAAERALLLALARATLALLEGRESNGYSEIKVALAAVEQKDRA
jgi:hypothetical protein